jgi:hypothetical protein
MKHWYLMLWCRRLGRRMSQNERPNSCTVEIRCCSEDPAFDALAALGGQTVPMPFWQDLQGSDEVLSDLGALTTGKITATSDTAVIHNRGKAWSTNDLAGALAGSDPARQIAELVVTKPPHSN